MLSNIELKPLRKNAKNASYQVFDMNETGDMVTKVTTYATIEEAFKHVFIKRHGDIVSIGPNGGLKMFWSDWHKEIRFGGHATSYEKSAWNEKFCFLMGSHNFS